MRAIFRAALSSKWGLIAILLLAGPACFANSALALDLDSSSRATVEMCERNVDISPKSLLAWLKATFENGDVLSRNFYSSDAFSAVCGHAQIVNGAPSLERITVKFYQPQLTGAMVNMVLFDRGGKRRAVSNLYFSRGNPLHLREIEDVFGRGWSDLRDFPVGATGWNGFGRTIK